MLRILHTILIILITTVAASAQARVDIFADTQGNDSLQKLVDIFTDQLKRAVSTQFTIKPTSSYNGRGIWLGLSKSSSATVKAPAKLRTAGIEAFAITADDKTVQVMGNSNAGLSHGVFSYLHTIGYRFYFPNKEWHIIPSNPRLFQKINTVSGPYFYHRRIWYGYGTGSKIADADYAFWVKANRMGGSINAYFGHSYGNIMARNKEEFAKHPEWLWPKATPNMTYTGDEKFDVSNEELIQLLIKDTEKQIELSLKNKTEAYKMISLAPSDGLGTCNSPACQKIGTITDRVYYPVNRVAKAISKKYPSTLIGCLAYGEYIAPPTKKVEPNVFVGITTAFNTTKYSTEQLVDQWRQKGAITGIYDYFSWYAWDQDLPGQSLASRPNDIVNTLKKYQAVGVRAYEGESSQGWISKGLGYYLAANTMWNPSFNAAAAKTEFFKRCFLNAAAPMEKLWNEWEKYSFKMVREDYLARWIDYVAEAGRLEKNTDVRKRLFQVKSYLHYLELYRAYQASGRTEASLLALLSYGYRKLDDGSVAGFPAFYELGNRSGIEGMAYSDKAKWRTNAGPVSDQELDGLITADRKRLKTTQAVKTFPTTTKLTTVPNIGKYEKLTKGTNSWDGKGWWYTNEWVIQVTKKGAASYMEYSGNRLSNTPEIKAAKITIYNYKPDGNVSNDKPVFSYEYTQKLTKQKISLGSLQPGFYTVVIEDPTAFIVSFSPSVNFSQVFRPNRMIHASALDAAFIYVPEGVKYFNVIKPKLLDLITPTGRTLSYPDNHKPEEVQVEVLKGEAGLWRVRLYDQVIFEGIPPFISTSASQMLIPAGN